MKVSRIGVIFCFLFLFSCHLPPQGRVILCAGDSITERGYARYLQEIFDEKGVEGRVINMGIRGHTSGEYLSFLRSKASESLGLSPDFILLQLGTNDVRVDGDHTPADKFYGNMKEIIGIFKTFKNRQGRPSVIFLATIPPIPEGDFRNFSSDSPRRVVEEINPLIVRLAREEGLELVDIYSVFSEEPTLLPEIHPTQDGYMAMARRWFDFLSEK